MPVKALVHALETLKAREQSLERQIHKLERRGLRMTPLERRRSAELKKLRLRTKDHLSRLATARA